MSKTDPKDSTPADLEALLYDREVVPIYLAAEAHLKRLEPMGVSVHATSAIRAFFVGNLAYDEMLRKRGEAPVYETFAELSERDPEQHEQAIRNLDEVVTRFGFEL